MERYEAYKDSGVEWIGEVPEHWGVSKFAFAGTTSLGKMLTPNPETEDDQLLPYLCAANVKESGIVLEQLKEMYFSPKDGDKYMLMCSDLVVVEGGNVGLSHVWTGGEMRIQNALHRFRANEQYVAEYLKYSLDVAKNAGYIDLVCNKATIAHFTSEKLMETPVCCIPLCEQRAIADYLDEKTAEIDSIVSETERSIELLREYRKSVISEAVTKGLDPDVPTKDSGVEWIGDIPETWETTKVKYLAACLNGDRGVNYPSGDDMVEEGVAFVTTDSIHGTCIDFDRVKRITEERYGLLGGVKLRIGDIVYCLRGSVGVCAINSAENSGTVASSLMVIRSFGCDSKWLLYVLESEVVSLQVSELTNGTCAANLSAENVTRFDLPFPSVEEQHAIRDYFDTKTSEIDALIADKERQVELLKEYRKSLISEAVTGKFKVPGVK